MSLQTILAKSTRLDRCIARIHHEFSGDPDQLSSDFLVQDSVVLNLQRACEQVIDIAQLLTRVAGLGRPATNKELFQQLEGERIIDAALSNSLQGLIGFRNVAVHEYQKLDLAIVHAVIDKELPEMQKFAAIAALYAEARDLPG